MNLQKILSNPSRASSDVESLGSQPDTYHSFSENQFENVKIHTAGIRPLADTSESSQGNDKSSKTWGASSLKECQVRSVIPLGGICRKFDPLVKYALFKDIDRTGRICRRPKMIGGLEGTAGSRDMEMLKEIGEEAGTTSRKLEPYAVIEDSRVSDGKRIESVLHFYAADLVSIPSPGIVDPDEFEYDAEGYRTHEVMYLRRDEINRECFPGSAQAVNTLEKLTLGGRLRINERLPNEFIAEVYRRSGKSIRADCEFIFTRCRGRPVNGKKRVSLLVKTDWCWHNEDLSWTRNKSGAFKEFVKDYSRSDEFKRLKNRLFGGDILNKYFTDGS